LNSLVLATGMMNDKLAISDHEGRSIHFSFYQRRVGIRLDRLRRAKRRGHAANSPDADEAKLSLSILESPLRKTSASPGRTMSRARLKRALRRSRYRSSWPRSCNTGKALSEVMNGGCNVRPNWKRKNGKGSAKRSGQNGNDTSGSNKPASIVCSRALLHFSKPEQSGGTLKRFVRPKRTMQLALAKSWNVGASGRWLKRRGLIP
jgi:hypothetical protein